MTQIRIGNSAVGIIGLKAVMEEVNQEYGDKRDREVQGELLNRLCRRNYIPEKVKESYENVFMREFKKFLGRPFEDETPEGIQIKVLGPGCAQCDRLEQELMQVMAETGIVADMEHVRDIKEIGGYGVMGTPALLINGHVKSIGKFPPKVNLSLNG
mgnify:CR=1 FL=1